MLKKCRMSWKTGSVRHNYSKRQLSANKPANCWRRPGVGGGERTHVQYVLKNKDRRLEINVSNQRNLIPEDHLWFVIQSLAQWLPSSTQTLEFSNFQSGEWDPLERGCNFISGWGGIKKTTGCYHFGIWNWAPPTWNACNLYFPERNTTGLLSRHRGALVS